MYNVYVYKYFRLFLTFNAMYFLNVRCKNIIFVSVACMQYLSVAVRLMPVLMAAYLVKM